MELINTGTKVIPVMALGIAAGGGDAKKTTAALTTAAAAVSKLGAAKERKWLR